MKTVFTSAEIPHLWANRIGRYIRNSSHSMFTSRDGALLHSYGNHFVLGAFLKNDKGAELLVIGCARHSNTTSKHQARTRYALTAKQHESAIYCYRTISAHHCEPIAIADMCIAEACKYLEKSHGQRAWRDGSIAFARRQFDYARRLLEFANQKSNVPVIGENPSKEDIREILRNIKARESLANARSCLDRARGLSAHAEFDARSAQWLSADRRLTDAVVLIDRAIAQYGGAGRKPAPDVIRLRAKIRALTDSIAPEVKKAAERVEAAERADALRDAYAALSEYRRQRIGFRRGPLVGWASHRIQHVRPDAEVDRVRNRIARIKWVENARLIANGAYASMRVLRDTATQLRATPNDPELIRGIDARIATEEFAEQKRIADAAQAIERWRAGGAVNLPNDIPTMVRRQGDELVTSRGARVPVSHAIRIMPIVRRVAESGGKDGLSVSIGFFKLTRIEADYSLTIGCHEIPGAETLAVIEMLNFVSTTSEQRT